jgi:hypothetical protein
MNVPTFLKKLFVDPGLPRSIDVAEQHNHLDLAFVVDTTSSMGPFIGAARQHMTGMLRTVTANAATPINLWLGLVEYRDHPPQDRSFVTREYAFTPDLDQVQKVIQGLKPEGGGDAPEAVQDGLQAAGQRLAWRSHSRRVAVLIGDSPPHGWSRREGSSQGVCLCGLTADATTALLEAKGVTLYALGLTTAVDLSFSRLARATGGAYFAAHRGQDAIPALEAVLAQEFADLDFDRRVLGWWLQHPAGMADELAAALASPPGRVAASLSRLGRRGLLNGEMPVVAADVES